MSEYTGLELGGTWNKLEGQKTKKSKFGFMLGMRTDQGWNATSYIDSHGL